MVRNLVGSMLAVNDGTISMDRFKDLFDNPEVGKTH